MNYNKLFKKCNEIWEKVINIIYKVFDSDPVFDKKYIKTKIKVYNKKFHKCQHKFPR